MQTIRAIISVVDPVLLDYLPPKPRWFVDTFLQQTYLSEAAFVAAICGDKYSKGYYTKLKSRTLHLLENLAVASPPPGNNLVKKKYEICQKKLLVAQKIMLRSGRSAGIRLVRRVYDLAKEYEFYNLASEAASILFNYHTHYEPSRRKAQYYRDQAEEHLTLHSSEKKTEHIYNDTMAVLKRSARPELLATAIKQVEQLPVLNTRSRSFLYILKIHYFLHRSDYHTVSKMCQDALRIFQGSKAVYVSHYQFFHTKRGTAQMAIQDCQGAAASFQAAREYVQASDYNDYVLRFYETLNALRSGDYQQAFDLYRQNRHCRFELLREQFAIIEAYLCYLTYTGQLPHKKTFRLGKYLNDTFKAQADKQGDNINILIAELLVYLARDRGKFIDRVEAIKNYSYRHLRDKAVRRAKWFIKILCLLPSVDFHPGALAKRAKTYIDKLAQHPVSMGENFAIEIIPFEDLLEMIRRQLERRVA